MFVSSLFKHTCRNLTQIRSFGLDRANKVVKLSALIKLDNHPYKVLGITQGKRGKGGGFVRAKIQHLFTGSTFEKTFGSDDMVEEAEFVKRVAQFSWKEGDVHVFIDQTTFEEIRLTNEQVNSDIKFKEGDTYKLLQVDGKCIGVDSYGNSE